MAQNGQYLTADRGDILTDPGANQPGKREKQKQEKGYKKEKREFDNHSIVSIFSFFTNGLKIFSGIQLGLFSGALTCSRHPLKTCTFFVPRSLRACLKII